MGLWQYSLDMATRILIADDDSTIRMLLRRLLEGHAAWEVCGEASTGSDAIEKANQLDPDLVILDFAMPNKNGIQAAQEISHTHAGIPMLLVTVQQISRQLAEVAQRVGFRGAVTKSSGSEVVRGVDAITRNQTYFSVDESVSA